MVSRLPDIRSGLELDNGSLGLLLLAISVGSVIALPLSGRLIDRIGATCRHPARRGPGRRRPAVAMTGVVTDVVALTVLGFFIDGIGIAVWDVSMNVEAAEVERRFGRTMMPRFHAGWSIGSFAGAAIGIPMAALHAPLLLHVPVFAIVAAARAPGARRRAYLPPTVTHEDRQAVACSPWREPRTLAIGVMVLAFALSEGAANDWLSLALIDGYDVRHWVGVAGFTLFVTSMFVGRLTGPIVLDRYGRAPVLWGSAAAAFVGILLVVFGGNVVLVGARHRRLGPRRVPRLPGRHERGGRRPAARGPPGQRGLDDRLHGVPGRAAAARPARRPHRHPGDAAGDRRSDDPRRADRLRRSPADGPRRSRKSVADRPVPTVSARRPAPRARRRSRGSRAGPG